MPAGTIALTNNSTAVTGTGTSFTAELKANDFVVAVVGGVAYTLGIKSVDSNTSLTLAQSYTGPAASGLAWTPVPFGTMTAITAQLAAQVTYAVRGFNLDKVNWQRVFTATGNITVSLPDGTSWQGPSWGYMATQFANKVDKSTLGDAATKSIGTTAGTVAAGDDSRIVNAVQPNTNPFLLALELSSDTPYIDFHVNSTTANYDTRLINSSSGNLDLMAASGNASLRVYGGYRCRSGTAGAFGNAFNYNWNSSSQMEVWVDTSRVGAISLAAVSDKGLKKDIRYRDDATKALAEVMQWRPADFKMKARGIMPETSDQLGFIANDIFEVSPECVSGTGLPENYDIEDDPNNSDAFYLNQVPMIAKLTQAIQAQQKIIDDQVEIIKAMGIRLKDLDGLDG